jgi:hypothetical protein
MTTKQIFFAFGAALCVWLAVMVTVTLLPNAAPAALVMFPSEQFIDALTSDFRIIDHTAVSVTIASDQSNPASLYALGALIVLPAGLTGCIPKLLSNPAA